jgi:Cof subfamily protein (haloacid dehalogenase superfamily)
LRYNHKQEVLRLRERLFSGVLLVTDLDGTLLDDNHELTAGNLAALRGFMREGGLFTLATGRSVMGAEYVMRSLPVNTAVIYSNGGVIYDPGTGEYIHIEYMSEGARAMADVVLARYPGAGVEIICKEDKFCINRGLAIQAHYDYVHCTGTDIASPAQAAQPWVKLLIVDLPPVVREIGEWLSAEYGHIHEICYSAGTILEVQDKGVHKGAGVARLVRHLGLSPEHTYACGDNDNDIPMLRQFHSFAPATAAPGAIQAASCVGPGNNEDFMAFVIHELERRYAG